MYVFPESPAENEWVSRCSRREGEDQVGGDNTHQVMVAGKSELVRKRHGMGGMRNENETAERRDSESPRGTRTGSIQ